VCIADQACAASRDLGGMRADCTRAADGLGRSAKRFLQKTAEYFPLPSSWGKMRWVFPGRVICGGAHSGCPAIVVARKGLPLSNVGARLSGRREKRSSPVFRKCASEAGGGGAWSGMRYQHHPVSVYSRSMNLPLRQGIFNLRRVRRRFRAKWCRKLTNFRKRNQEKKKRN